MLSDWNLFQWIMTVIVTISLTYVSIMKNILTIRQIFFEKKSIFIVYQ